MRKIPLVVSLFALIAIVSSIVYLQRSDIVLRGNSNTASKVYSFDQCAAAGFPVMESYPRQCTSGKVTFVEPIANMPVQEEVVFESLTSGSVIQSPIEVKGKVTGAWCFEAQCPISVLDGNGVEVGAGTAVVSDWMTTERVAFTATVNFTAPTTDSGFIELRNDNPSGLPENDKGVRVPVRFR